jgi:protein-tyrosine phosphatase
MAEALLRTHLEERGASARVHSAGTLHWDGPATEQALEVMHELGIDMTTHRSRPLSAELLRDADLVLGMTRNHVWAAASHSPEAVDRAFLVGELVRLGTTVGPRGAGETVRDWVARVAAARPDAGPVGRATDEVADPLGEPLEAFRETARRLDAELKAVAALLAP